MSFAYKKALYELLGTFMPFQIITQQGIIEVKAGEVPLGLLASLGHLSEDDYFLPHILWCIVQPSFEFSGDNTCTVFLVR